MSRKYKQQQHSNSSILLVDDSREYLEATRAILEREGHKVETASSGSEALELLKHNHYHLLLLDYFMPEMTGEEVIEQLRQFNKNIQVVLQTGYASEKPPRDMLKQLDIQGYYDKSDGPDQLLLWTDIGLKAARQVQMLEKSRKGLSYILSATPDLYRLQPFEDLLHGILWQFSGLLNFTDSFLAVMPPMKDEMTLNSFLSLHDTDDFLLNIHAGVGRFFKQKKIADLIPPQEHDLIKETLEEGSLKISDNSTVLPLEVGDKVIGVIYLQKAIENSMDMELLKVFANQAAVAIQNTQLFEMATIDPLTGVYIQRFYKKWILRELKNTLRHNHPLSILLLDIYKLNEINRQGGHTAGDKAIIKFARLLKDVTRSSDVVCRVNGNLFAILLHETDASGLSILIKRLQNSMKDQEIQLPDERIPIQATIGAAVLIPQGEFDLTSLQEEYFEMLARHLQDSAEISLNMAKESGGAICGEIQNLKWPDDEELPIEEMGDC